MKEIQFPIVIIKNKQAPIYYVGKEKKFGEVSKSGENFYKSGVIYDAKGNVFKISGIKNIAKASLIRSIISFQPLYVVKVSVENTTRIDIAEVKEILKNQVATYKRYWLSLDLIEDLKEKIDSQNSFMSLYKMFK